MKIFAKHESGDGETLLLTEATLVADAEELREIASFINRCADGMEDEGDDWEYEEFDSMHATGPALVVFNSNLID